MSEHLFNWLAKRREMNVFKMIQDHFKLSTDCVEEIVTATKKMIAGDRNASNLHILRLNSKEKEADTLRGNILNELSKAEFSPSQREDLVHLVKRVDMVADYARAAGRCLTLLSLDKYPEKVKEIATVMVEKSLENASTLKLALQNLTINLDEVIKYCDKVERIEEDVDEIHATARGVLKDLPSSTMNTGEFIVLSEFFNDLEMINDSCEDSVDILRLIVVKLK
ncbi:MAG: DUF47 family protein [Nitrososphaeria archaeon]